MVQLKFLHSEKATKFCEIFTMILTVCTAVKSKVEISQNFVAFSECMNFINISQHLIFSSKAKQCLECNYTIRPTVYVTFWSPFNAFFVQNSLRLDVSLQPFILQFTKDYCKDQKNWHAIACSYYGLMNESKWTKLICWPRFFDIQVYKLTHPIYTYFWCVTLIL